MTLWFLIREHCALWMKPPMFSESLLLCVPLRCDLILSTTSASALLQPGFHSIKVVTKWNSAGWVWCCASGNLAPHHRYHKTSTTYACRRCDKGPAQRHKAGLPRNL